MFNTVKEMTGQRTVPNIFIAQQQIGGNSELQALNKTGDLDEMLRKAGALA
jgi:glutaredoxin 3